MWHCRRNQPLPFTVLFRAQAKKLTYQLLIKNAATGQQLLHVVSLLQDLVYPGGVGRHGRFIMQLASAHAEEAASALLPSVPSSAALRAAAEATMRREPHRLAVWITYTGVAADAFLPERVIGGSRNAIS